MTVDLVVHHGSCPAGMASAQRQTNQSRHPAGARSTTHPASNRSGRFPPLRARGSGRADGGGTRDNGAMTVKALLTDMFGVIAQIQPESARTRLVRIAGAEPDAFWAAYWAHRPDYDQGISTPLDYWSRVACDLRMDFGTEQLMELHAADIDSWSLRHQDMIDALPRVRAAGYRLALLSNIPTSLAEHVYAVDEFMDEFEVVAMSCHIDAVKPSPAAYQWCIDRMDLPADEILFIDDSQRNVDAAAAVGLQARLYRGVDDLFATLSIEKSRI
ncbi:HAD family phosphatase [Propionibacterium freudenreichii]|nr:HAD family phosphatase [Propionibacterium freudenreichii]